jgi:protein TonB
VGNPKLLFASFIVATSITFSAFAQDTVKNVQSSKPIFTVIDQEPVFPGGDQAFLKYITNNLKYPEIAKLIGLKGKVFVSFVVDHDGTITDVKPIRCLGAGCESEAVRVISMSPKWSPGMSKGKTVRVVYTIPINFYFLDDSRTTYIKRLRNSDYGFVFYIKNKTYSLDEAEAILGKKFDSSSIETVEDYDNPKYTMPNKKAVYLIVMKNS